MRRALWLCLALAGCDDGPIPAAQYGGELYGESALSQSGFNAFSCETCHPRAPDPGDVRIGLSLADSAFRDGYWGGQVEPLSDAVSFCLVQFMKSDPLDVTDVRGRALYEYLVSISPNHDLPVRPASFVENVAEVDRGDAARGAAVYDRACRVCHGEPHSGAGRIADYASIVPEASVGFAQESGVATSLVVIEKVRHGRFFGVGGSMPPFSREALSDEDLGALLSYLGI